jgi:tripartite-type tricarboxylate transporter receptor subunit TctC
MEPAVAILGGASPSRTEDFPSRTVAIVVPFPAGGPVDELARLIGNGLRENIRLAK